MAGRSKSRDDLNAIDAGWVDLARELAEELEEEDARARVLAAELPLVLEPAAAPPAPTSAPSGMVTPVPTPRPAVPDARASAVTPRPPGSTTPRPAVPTPRPRTTPPPRVAEATSDPEIDDIVASLEPPDEPAGPVTTAPPAAETPEAPASADAPRVRVTPTRTLMPPYVPVARPPSRPKVAPVAPPRPPIPEPTTRVATPAIPPPRTLLAFGAFGARVEQTTPAVQRPQVPTPLVKVIEADSAGHDALSLTLDLDEMSKPVRKPSAPRVPIDMSDFADDAVITRVKTPLGMPAPEILPIVAPPPEPEVVPPPRPATPEPRRRSPTPAEVSMEPLAPGEAIGFEHELDLPVEPGVAREFALDEGMDLALDALGAVERAAEPESIGARTEREMRERFDGGDFTAALEAAEWLLKDQPAHEQAQRYAASCREVLLQMYAVRLGALDRVPAIVVGAGDVKNLGLDHRAGFVLSCIDGNTSFAEILDLSGMPPLESYRILCDLLLANVIAVR